MKKAKKNVPSATEPKPEDAKEPEAAVSEAVVQKQEVPPPAAAEKPIVVSAPLKNILTRISNLTPDELAIINKFGMPLKDFADWMFMMEQTLRQVPNVTEKGIAEELYKRSMAERQQMTAGGGIPSTGTAGGGGTVNQIIAALSNPEVIKLLGGSSSNPLMDKYVEALITRNMNEMVESTTFDKIMREYFVKKMSKELGEPLMSVTPKAVGV